MRTAYGIPMCAFDELQCQSDGNTRHAKNDCLLNIMCVCVFVQWGTHQFIWNSMMSDACLDILLAAVEWGYAS